MQHEANPRSWAALTAKQVANVLGTSVERVRAYVRAGFVSPERGARGEYLFEFRHVVLLRAAQTLVERLPARKVRRALRRLKQTLPHGRALTTVSFAVEGDQVVVRDRGARWHAESGQVLLDFEVDELAKRVAPIATASAAARMADETSLDAGDWYDLGVELEACSEVAAERAYSRALELEPSHVDTLVNLGRLVHERGQVTQAILLYQRALALTPEDATAHYNLGVALEDAGRLPAALACYERSVELDQNCADAHYNAARLHELQGDKMAALRHFHAYRALMRKE